MVVFVFLQETNVLLFFCFEPERNVLSVFPALYSQVCETFFLDEEFWMQGKFEGSLEDKITETLLHECIEQR